MAFFEPPFQDLRHTRFIYTLFETWKAYDRLSIALAAEELHVRADISPRRRFVKGWVTLRLYIKLKVTFTASIYGTLNRGMVADESFHTTKLCSRVCSTEIEFY